MHPQTAGTTVFIVAVLNNDSPEVLSVGHEEYGYNSANTRQGQPR